MRASATILLFALQLLCCGIVSAQQSSSAKNNAILERARTYVDTVAISRQDSFFYDNPKLEGRAGRRKRFWFALSADSSLVEIHTEHRIRATRYTNYYYLKKGKLYYAVESIIDHPDDPEMMIGWAGYYAFRNGKLIAISSLGHGKSESHEGWFSEIYVPKEFTSALRRVNLYRAAAAAR